MNPEKAITIKPNVAIFRSKLIFVVNIYDRHVYKLIVNLLEIY